MRRKHLFFQFFVLLVVLILIWLVSSNTLSNLRERDLDVSFRFLSDEAGFGIGFTLIPFDEANTYARAFLVGLLNTLLVSALGVVFATVLGLVIALCRISGNWLLSLSAQIYVEAVRNVPFLIHVLFWAAVTVRYTPKVRDSFSVFGVVFFNNRGIFLPMPLVGATELLTVVVLTSLVVGAVVLAANFVWRSRYLQGASHSDLAMTLALAVVSFVALLPLTAWYFEWDTPELSGFSYRGGVTVPPELAALVVALAVYNSAFVAEIIRGSILAVDRGQWDAAQALGLSRGRILRLVVVPQALRITIPPLSNQYILLLKGSALATAIGYPDVVNVFAGTVLNQTGRAIEIMSITLAVYLCVSMGLAALMNLYNRRLARHGQSIQSSSASGSPIVKTLRKSSAVSGYGVFKSWIRTRLFPTPLQGMFTVSIGGFALLGLARLVGWGLVDATWFGSDRGDCVGSGACWAFISARFGQFIYGFYPDQERWRVNIVAGILVVGVAWLVLPFMRYKKWIGAFMLGAFPPVALWLLLGGSGLSQVKTSQWGGLMLTVIIGTSAIIISLPVGVLLALSRRSHILILGLVATGFVEVMRGVPLIVVLFISVIMLPIFLPAGMGFNTLALAVVGIAAQASAFMAEAVRGGLNALANGQYEAARSLGMGYWRTNILVILPQALRIAIPAIVNTCIAFFKDSTLVMIVGLFDVLNIVIAGSSDPAWLGTEIEGFVFVASAFWVVTFSFSRYSHYLETCLSSGSSK